MKHKRLKHRFVEEIPDELEPGVLYVSIEYGTLIHSCCCGCGKEVVTPLGPNDWKLTYDGESISLWPSVGNWDFPCRSHYIIRGNRVIEAEDWSDDRVMSERSKAQQARTPDGSAAKSNPSRNDQRNGDSGFLPRWIRRLWNQVRS